MAQLSEPTPSFLDFCRQALFYNGFEVLAEQMVDSGADFIAKSEQETAQGRIQFEWMVQCTTRPVSVEVVQTAVQLSFRHRRPVLIITTAEITSAGREFLDKSGIIKDAPVVVWDQPVLARLSIQRPWFGEVLRRFSSQTVTRSELSFSESLLQRMISCKPGKKQWKRYEELMVDAINFLFVPPLGQPHIQSRTQDGLEIRDALYPNKADAGFWLRMQHHWGCHFALIELKNLSNGVGAEEVDQVRLYTQRKSIGRLAFVVGRVPARKSAKDAARVAYQYSDLMVVLLDDSHVTEMIKMKSTGNNPATILEDLIDQALLAY